MAPLGMIGEEHMRITLRDFVDGKADLAFGHYGIPRPIYALGQREGEDDMKL